jgi:peptidyl-prolyl isomerase D
VFGEVINGKNLVRKVENLPTQGDKPQGGDIIVADCGELSGAAYDSAAEKAPDSTGDPYEDFPDDQGEDLKGTEYFKIASDLKDMGNKAFKAGQNSLAIEKYQKAIRYLNEYPETSDSDPLELKGQLKQLKFTLHSNSALVANKAERYQEAQKWAGFALDVAPSDVKDVDKGKAYYRRAIARIGLKGRRAGGPGPSCQASSWGSRHRQRENEAQEERPGARQKGEGGLQEVLHLGC